MTGKFDTGLNLPSIRLVSIVSTAPMNHNNRGTGVCAYDRVWQIKIKLIGVGRVVDDRDVPQCGILGVGYGR